MLKIWLAAAVSVALITAPVASAYAQAAATEKTEKKPAAKKAAKPLTPQQEKMKECASVKWKAEKAAKKVSGRAAYNKFMSECLKGHAA